MTRGRNLRVIIVALVAAAIWPHAISAQDRPTLFLHGLTGSGSDWAATADRLRMRVAIEPRTPDLPWRQPYEQQAQALSQSPVMSGLSSAPLAIGHSNGGIVARQLSRLRRVDGIATIGTPHNGAPIVPGFGQWLWFQAAAPAYIGTVVQAFGSYSDWSWTFAYIQGALSWISDFSIWSVVYLGASMGVDAALPVVNEMQPGSSYLASLNSSDNLRREAAEVSARVGVVSVAHNFYWAGPARAIAPAHADEIATALYATALGLQYWGSYIMTQADPTDIVAMHESSSLMSLAGYLLSVDPFYCQVVSGNPLGECVANDGIVPVNSQAYPGAPNLLLGGDNNGPAHSQERQWGEDALYDALVWYMHVPLRTSTPPPPPPPPGAPLPGPPTPVPPVTQPNDPGSSDPPNSPSEPRQPRGVPTAGSDPGLLLAGGVIWPDGRIESGDGRFKLVYQGDGNLVLYDEAWIPLWATHTEGTGAGAVVMQGDGNFVMYDAQGVPKWASGDSYGHPGAYLLLQTDGNVVIYDVDGTPLWATGTWR